MPKSVSKTSGDRAIESADQQPKSIKRRARKASRLTDTSASLGSRGRKPAHSHFTRGLGNRRNRLPQGVRTDRTDAADPKRIDGGQFSGVENESALAHPTVELAEIIGRIGR